MDGPSLINFTVVAVPQLVEGILAAAKLTDKEIDLYLFHQATRKMLEQLRERLKISEQRLPMVLESCGNTVSSTIPILIDTLRKDGRLQRGMRSMLVGFGVGWSWAGGIWRETFPSS
jgi:3-oxoacyl-[acyl-carrier-protein] synthase-3